MRVIREYLKILDDVKDLLSCLPNIEDYTDTFYDDINYLIDIQIDKFQMKLENVEKELKEIGTKTKRK